MTHHFAALRSGLIVAALTAALAGLTGCSSSAPSTTTDSAQPAPPAATSAPGAVSLGPAFNSVPDGYQISPPAGWVQRPTNPQDGISVLFTTPSPDTSTGKPFNTNLNVYITPAKGDLDASVAQSIAVYPSILQNFQVVINEPTVVSGNHPAHFIGGTYDIPGVGRVRNLQLVAVEAGKLYTATITVPEQGYAALQTNAVASLSSFMFG